MRYLGLDETVGDGELADLWIAEGGYLRAPAETFVGVATTRDGVSLQQILQDRPDVFRAFYDEFHGARNDRHSDAWILRVGGETVEDYANYWYEQHGRWEGYAPRTGLASPDPDALPPGIVETGRTTADGVLLSRILTDRPDVFRAFFTEYSGENNDRRSSAWVDRVGGATVEDYANYWYENHGRPYGYVPSSPAAPEEPLEPAPTDEAGPGLPLPADDEGLYVPPGDVIPDDGTPTGQGLFGGDGGDII